jgi:hypothetical protein
MVLVDIHLHNYGEYIPLMLAIYSKNNAAHSNVFTLLSTTCLVNVRHSESLYLPSFIFTFIDAGFSET